jgi:hypothetical protein
VGDGGGEGAERAEPVRFLATERVGGGDDRRPESASGPSQGASRWGFPGAEGVPRKNAPLHGSAYIIGERAPVGVRGGTAGIASEPVGRGLAQGGAGGHGQGETGDRERVRADGDDRRGVPATIQLVSLRMITRGADRFR